MALDGVGVVAPVVGYGEAMMGLIGLDGVHDPGLGERLLQEILLFFGERLVLDGATHIHGGLDFTRLVVRAVGVVSVGQIPSMEGG